MSKLKDLRKNLLLPILVVLISGINFTRLEGIENIKAIHEFTLIVLGAGLGVLLVNLLTIWKNKDQA